MRAAIDQYRHAIDLDPPDGAWIEQSLQSVFVDACYNLARAYQEVGDLGGAAAQYELVLARHPTHPLTHYNLGHVKHQQGDGAAAKECFEIAIELAPTDVDAQVSLGNVQREMGARARRSPRTPPLSSSSLAMGSRSTTSAPPTTTRAT